MSGPEESERKEETDPDALARALEAELIMKRAHWQKLQTRRGTWRALSLLFLFLILFGAFLAYFYFATTVSRPGREEPGNGQVESDR